MPEIKVSVAARRESLLGRLAQHNPELTDAIGTINVVGVLDHTGTPVEDFRFTQTVSSQGIKGRVKIKGHGDVVFEVCYQTGKFEVVDCTLGCESLALVLDVITENYNQRPKEGRRRL